VLRTRSRSDERRLEVALTEEGARLRAEAEKIPYEIVETLGVELSELEELHVALTKVISASRRALDTR
jgi:MarR family transcriptional regulator, organic hydroperoxide resistance regulator